MFTEEVALHLSKIVSALRMDSNYPLVDATDNSLGVIIGTL